MACLIHLNLPTHWMMTMPDVTVLEILFYGEPVGTLTRIQGDRSIFAFNEGYIENTDRPTLSLSFKDSLGQLITEFRPLQTSIMPFFSNMLPEGHMREYLAGRAGVKPQREFFLLWVLGQDLPGAVTVRPVDGESWPPGDNHDEYEQNDKLHEQALRFSLAGVQLKFSAVMDASGGLTIPVRGVGGSWIVKLPSMIFEAVPENEYAMMTLADMVGIDVPEISLVPVKDIGGLPEGINNIRGSALAIKRFDRLENGSRVHVEDFAQVFNVYPKDKYEKASYKNIANVLSMETTDDDITEFIRRLVFNTLIGNADMHLKNWSLIYRDRQTAALSPAYDFVSTIVYLKDEKAGLKYARTKRMDEFTGDELAYMAGKAHIPKKLVLDAAKDTVKRFHDTWSSEKNNLELEKKTIDAIDTHIAKLPIARI